MAELVFIGLGLHDEQDISLRGLSDAQEAEAVFIELYTSLMTGLQIDKLGQLIGRKIQLVNRKTLEDENGAPILHAAKRGKTVFLVPGDPMIATTHVDLRLRAEEHSIPTRIVHGATIVSAACGVTGLQNYKFGRSITIPFPFNDRLSDQPYDVIAHNLDEGLHTLCFLDLAAEEQRYLSVKEALEGLLIVGKRKQEDKIREDTLAVGLARLGSPDQVVKADAINRLKKHKFGEPPYTLIFPGNLHFMEAEALIALADAPTRIRGKPNET
ncbi:MAG: diphthine synthase [Candidatus Bathyarchaeota archaeon]|nr:MAG: diphthine synthase [Candidatus Bathyarchaeota archaeon]